MNLFRTIFLSWRKSIGSRRHIIGTIKKTALEESFEYDFKNVIEASKEGLTRYTEFPDFNKVYTKNVIDIFSQRLIKFDRTDTQDYLDFWEIDKSLIHNKFYLLGKTMGITPLDNFEFLADYNPVKGLIFITDLAGLSHANLESNILKPGDKLNYYFERSNSFDSKAVALYYDSLKIGYIKRIHNNVFHKNNSMNFDIRVKRIESNGVISRIFARIEIK